MLIKVDIPREPYNVRVGEELGEFGVRMSGYTGKKRVFLITDDNVAGLYMDSIKSSLKKASFDCETVSIKAGEKYKTLETVKDIYKRMNEAKIERFTPVVGFGGGVVGDIAGFVSSTYLRGLPFFNVPTTVVAQVDSSVGGKTGVNFEGGKNLVGSFYQPRYVHCDVELLKTLDDREYRAGLAEIVKHSVIKGDEFFSYLKENAESILRKDPSALEVIIAESVKTKADVVAKDEREKGLRRVLNLGHTIGHAIEVQSGYGALKHGEGVSIGMVAACRLGEKRGIPENITRRVKDILKRYGLPVSIPRDMDTEKILEVMKVDKKVRGGKIEFVLPVSLGNVQCGKPFSREEIIDVIDEMLEK